MAHPQAFLAAADGKHPVSKSTRHFTTYAWRLLLAAAAFFAVCGSEGLAQSGPFAGIAGNWAGGGIITLDDGSTERIRCRATYTVVGPGNNGLNQTLTCASDSYKFNLASDVEARGSALSGTWSESIRNVSGSLEGRGGGGNFQVIANGPGFSGNIALTTQGNKQSVVIRSQGAFRETSISLSRR